MNEPTASGSELVPVDVFKEQPSMSLVAALEEAGAVSIDKGLVLPFDLPYEKWEAIGMLLGKAKSALLWYASDWMNHGEHAYGEKYAQAQSILGYSKQTCINIASIGNRVKPKQRSRIIDFWVHEPVAKLGPAQQRALLKRAEEEGLSRSALRKIVKGEPDEDRYQDVSRDICEACGRPLP